MKGQDIRTTYPKVQYNLYRRSFDVKTHTFGEEQLVYDAVSQDKSATLPRISPDGKYLMFAEGRYGCFHSRHEEADIVCIPLRRDSALVEKSSALDLSLANSKGYSESYPTWSSNGHWIMIASRRYDGNYSRVYFAYFKDGKVAKAFLLPQADPEENTLRLKKLKSCDVVLLSGTLPYLYAKDFLDDLTVPWMYLKQDESSIATTLLSLLVQKSISLQRLSVDVMDNRFIEQVLNDIQTAEQPYIQTIDLHPHE